MKKIYLLGSERSGSNLLRSLLGNHSHISAPIAPHLCDAFYVHFNAYRNLPNDILLRDIQAYVNHSFSDWKLFIDIASFETKYGMDNFIEVLDGIYTEKALLEKKQTYFCKDNHIDKYALGISRIFPDAKFVYLYRDPRDQVASWLRTPVHLQTPYKAVMKWRAEQRACLQLSDFFGLKISFVKYENLVTNTELEMTRLLKELNMPIESACFQTDSKNMEAEKYRLWKNINKPIIKDNFSKYKDILNGNSLNMVESISSNEMKKFDYQPVTNQNWSMKNKYVFMLKEKIREKWSRRKNKDFIEKEMVMLRDKQKLMRDLFSKFHSK